MNHRDGPLSTYSQSTHPNMNPAFLAHNVLGSSEKKGEFSYHFSDAEESSDSVQHISDQTPADVIMSQTYQTPSKSNGMTNNVDKQSLDNFENGKAINSKPKRDFLEPEVKSPGSGAWDKAKEKLLQAQLEISQSKLFGLAQRIDACLAISKTDYSNSKVFQPSETSVSRSSVNDLKEEKTLQENPRNIKPESTNEKIPVKRETPEMIGKSAFGSTESSNEFGNGTLKKGNMKGKNEVTSSEVNRQQEEIAIFVSTPSKVEKENPPSFGNEFQKQFETVSSVVIETMNDIGKPKDAITARSGEFDTISPVLMNGKDKNLSPHKQVNGNFKEKLTNLKTSPRKEVIQSPIGGARFSFSNSTQPAKVISQRNSVGSVQKEPQPASKPKSNKMTPKISPKNGLNKKSGVGAQYGKKTTVNKYNFEEQNNEEQKDIFDLMDQSDLSPLPVPQKLEAKAETTQKPQVSSPKANQAKNNTKPNQNRQLLSIPHRKNNNLEIETSDDNRFEFTQTISPVLNDRKSSRGMTPGYQFDAPNLSITDTKNLSFDSALLGKDNSIKGMEQARESVGLNLKTETFRSGDEIRSNHSKSRAMSQGRQDRSFYDDELESSFVKAYTTRKNKIVNEADSFDERMSSDIYFRRRFKNELQQFLDQYQPKLSGEEAEELYERLVEDGRKRQLKSNKLELQRAKSHKLTIKSYPSIQEDQVNQTFDRLVADARKRFFIQEEKEKLKLLKLQEEIDDFEKELNKKKMNKTDESQLIGKMMHDANRRKIQHEKIQRVKFEAELREAEELMNKRFVSKNNRAKSKVREYIENQSEIKTQNQSRVESRAQSRGPTRIEKSPPRVMTKSFRSDQKLNDVTGTRITPKNDTKSSSNNNKPKFTAVKNRYLNIESPSHRVQTGESVKSTRKTSPKNEQLSSLQYLKSLRRDIDKYRNNIEENIYTIQSIDSLPLTESRIEGTKKTPASVKKLGLSNIHSPKGETATTPYKGSKKYKNVESKVAKHIEGKLTQSDINQDETAPKMKNVTSNKTRPKAASAYKPSNTSSTKSMKTVDKDQKLNSSRKLTDADEKEKKAKIQAKFMNAQDAINFVERLISDFKSGN